MLITTKDYKQTVSAGVVHEIVSYYCGSTILKQSALPGLFLFQDIWAGLLAFINLAQSSYVSMAAIGPLYI